MHVFREENAKLLQGNFQSHTFVQYLTKSLNTNQYPNASLKEKLNVIGALLLALFIITIYVSTAISIIISALVGVIWLSTGQFKKLPLVSSQLSVNRWAILLFLLLIFGLTYGNTPNEEANSVLRKYRELLYIPILSCFFTDERYRNWAWKAFFLGSVLTLAGSYLMDFKIMELNRYRTFTLKSRITHSIFLAYFLYFCLQKYFDSKKNLYLYILLVLLGVYNLYFVTQGRTGQLIFIILASLTALQHLNKKGVLLAFAAVALFLSLYLQFSDKSNRINTGLESAKIHFKEASKTKSNDRDLRLYYWRCASKLIIEKPWLGYGTGSFEQEYRRITGTVTEKLGNPHNEFLLITVQCGFLGLIIYLGFLFSQFHDSKLLNFTEKRLAQGLLVTLIVTSMFNSPILDHAEGHWFAVMIALCYSSLISKNQHKKL